MDTGLFYLSFLPVQLPSITPILLCLTLESYGNVVQHTQLVYPLLCSILCVASLLERARHKKITMGTATAVTAKATGAKSTSATVAAQTTIATKEQCQNVFALFLFQDVFLKSIEVENCFAVH